MDIKYDVSITSIGNLAKTFLENNNSAIMLDEGIRPNLADMVIEHTPGELTEDIKKGDKLLMGGIKYTVEKVGDVANDTIREEGHCTVIFNGEGSMPGKLSSKVRLCQHLRLALTLHSLKNNSSEQTEKALPAGSAFSVCFSPQSRHRHRFFLMIILHQISHAFPLDKKQRHIHICL